MIYFWCDESKSDWNSRWPVCQGYELHFIRLQDYTHVTIFYHVGHINELVIKITYSSPILFISYYINQSMWGKKLAFPISL